MSKVDPKWQPLYNLIDGIEKELKEVNIFRTAEDEKQTTGVLIMRNENGGLWLPEAFYTLELPWKDNRRNISRIPPGIYEARKYESPGFKREVIILEGVPGRDNIEIHPGNTVKNTTGCILVGSGWGDVNRDGIPDVTKSTKAMDKILSLLPDTFRVKIWDCFKNINN